MYSLTRILRDGVVTEEELLELHDEIAGILASYEPEELPVEHALTELVALLRGLVADDHLNMLESKSLDSWLQKNAHLGKVQPIDLIIERLSRMRSVTPVPTDELEALCAEIQDYVQSVQDTRRLERQTAAEYITDDPGVTTIHGRSVCFCGNFISASVNHLIQQAQQRGATVSTHPDHNLDFLVIGAFAADIWDNTPAGDVFLNSIKLKRQNADIRILSERRWLSLLATGS